MTINRAGRAALALLIMLIVAGLLALGIWQVERLSWKRALIAQVEQRLAAAPIPAPGPDAWGAIGKDQAYTRLVVRGAYLPHSDTFTQANTEIGPGFWVMTPLRTDRGFTVLINRGFVPGEQRGSVPAPTGPVTVTGLLRVTEPGGGFLRSNDPAANRWYSRDTAAIANARGAGTVAPYFIDADRGPAPWPRGGMTVIRFPNNHLVYALTWFSMAAMLAGMSLTLAWRRRRG